MSYWYFSLNIQRVINISCHIFDKCLNINEALLGVDNEERKRAAFSGGFGAQPLLFLLEGA